MTEQRLGILGGMGPQATLDLYQRIVDRTEASCDQDHLPTLIFSATKIPDRTESILNGTEEACFRQLLAGAKLLEQGGCTALAIPCNTSHYFFERLQAELSIPLIHMPRRTAARARAMGWRRVVIYGTDGTEKTGVYRQACAAEGVQAVSPPKELQRVVMSLIYDEIKAGKPGSPEKFAQMDRWLRETHCDGGILACTELSVYRTCNGLPDYYLDAMDVLAEECILACGYRLRTT